MGTLYVVATPIGNLEDVTLRALRLLRACDDVLAEDTRRTRVLLAHHGIPARPRSLHAHNEAARIRSVLDRLAEGRDVALVSDAGTPLVSDPGERLVAAARAAGHPVVAVPGASAVLAALVASGLPAVPFLFEGFLPRRAGERRARLAELVKRRETLVLFESPRRLAATLAELHAAFGPRRACVARELTKRFEETRCGTLEELALAFREGARGEITLVVEGAAAGAAGEQPSRGGQEDLDAAIRARLAAGASPREISQELAGETGAPRRSIYQRALRLREQRS